MPGNPRLAGGLERSKVRATRFAGALTCTRCRVTTTGGMASRHLKGQPLDDPRTEPANSHPPGLVTTMRMAARPSSYLQRTSAAPFDLCSVQYMRLRRCARIYPLAPQFAEWRSLQRRPIVDFLRSSCRSVRRPTATETWRRQSTSVSQHPETDRTDALRHRRTCRGVPVRRDLARWR